MTSDFDDTDRLAIEITECKNMGIEVLQPDVNQSFLEFAIVPDKKQIRFGLKAIKNVGSSAVEEILRARAIDGSFASLEDFASKVSSRIVNRKTLESLIKAGAFDRFADRSVLLGNLDVLVAYASRLQKQASSGQTDLFGELGGVVVAPKLTLDTTVEKHNSREQLQWERDLLGLYLSQHPLQAFDDFLREQAVPLSELKPEHDGKSVTVAGSINELREITTKTGQKMAFIKIADMNGEVELILFPNAYQQTTGIWQRDHVVLVQGKVNSKDREGNLSEEVKIMVDDAREVTVEQAQAYQAKGKTMKIPKPRKAVPMKSQGAKAPQPERVYIRLEDSDNQQLLISLKEAIDINSGDTEVVLVLGADKSKQIVKLPSRVNRESDVLAQLEELVGVANVKIQ
jgi:DNA polymerase-3 subunit alpha